MAIDNNRMREEVKKALGRSDVKYVIGYQKGAGASVSPCFVHPGGSAEKLMFSPLCANNLAVYLMRVDKPPLKKGEAEDVRKVGLLVKGCDSRAVVQILQENGLSRDRVLLFGVPCTGIIDAKKLEKKFPGASGAKSFEAKEDGKNFIITIDGKEHKVPKVELLLRKCSKCEYPNPIESDIMLGDKVEPMGREDYADVEKFKSMTLEEKWKYWERMFERCIRCYACRNACPLCYCKDCAADQVGPQWIRRSVNLSENTVWHLIRAYHHAGRCASCGECERACPMDIPLTELTKMLERDIKEMYDYTCGLDAKEKPLLGAYKPDDPEEFIE